MVNWSALADRKYDNIEYEAQTGRITAEANAGLARANTGMVAPLGMSQINRESAGAGLQRVQTRLAPGLAASEIANTNAQTSTLNTERPLIAPKTLAGIRLSDATARNTNAETTSRGLQNDMTRQYMDPSTQAIFEMLYGDSRFGFAKGTARVPGMGDGTVDTVPAALAPGEAVLNKPAAEMMGRGLIAVMNKLGMQKMGMV